LAFVVAGALALGGISMAQGPEPGAEQRPGPTTSAARLSDVDGQVQLSQGGQVLASQAMVNAPLFEGTEISTSEDGRAEVQFEDGSVARVSPNSSITIGVLRRQGASTVTELTLNGGLGYFEIQSSTEPNNFRVRFGNSVATASGFTILRINLDNPPGEMAVFSGNAHVEGSNSLAVDMHGGETLKLSGDMPGNYTVSDVIEPDSWDTWNSDRDQALTAQEAQRTTATDSVPDSNNPAWSDLDANGNWYDVPGQGYVWSPDEAENPGWDPYGCGSWMWTPGYGYVWVSCESWGYMPYAYGSWSYYNGFGWGWAPGFGNPWWCGGVYTVNIHNAPYRYEPPRRPRGGPVRPASPVHVAGGKYQPYPIVPVNRNSGDIHGAPVRVRSGPVTVAGNTVVPMRPIAPSLRPTAPRTGFVRETGQRANTPQNGSLNPSRPIYGIDTGSQGIIARPPGYFGNTYSPRPSAPASGYYPQRPAPPSGGYSPQPRPSAPAGGYSMPRPVAPSHGSYSAPMPSRPAPSMGGGAPHMSGGGGAAPAAPHAGGGGGPRK
jgi:hypothetical protein